MGQLSAQLFHGQVCVIPSLSHLQGAYKRSRVHFKSFIQFAFGVCCCQLAIWGPKIFHYQWIKPSNNLWRLQVLHRIFSRTWWMITSGCVMSSDTDLGAGYSDLRPSVDVDSTVGLPGDGAAHCVGDAHGQSSPLLAVTQGHQAVCSFPWWMEWQGSFREERHLNNWSFFISEEASPHPHVGLWICRAAVRQFWIFQDHRLPHLIGWWRSRRHPWTRECSCPGSRWPAPPWRAAQSAPPAPGGSGRGTTTRLGIVS